MPEIAHPFSSPGRWWRGNLHTHTTRSDGHKTPQDAVQWYADHGYDFVVITDHRRAPEKEDLTPPRDGFLVIPGTELDFTDRETKLGHHIVCIGVDDHIQLPEAVTIQEALDIAASRADVAYIAHPYWFGHDFGAYRGVKGHSGIEIYNATCEYLCCKGDSTAYWDSLLKSEPLWGFAADDAHWSRKDFGAGWVNVKAESLTREAITTALKTGQFYSSTGPVIEKVEVSETSVYIKTSPVDRIALIGPGYWGRLVAASHGQTISEAEFKLGGNVSLASRYLRLQAVDPNGKVAWTNPIVWNG